MARATLARFGSLTERAMSREELLSQVGEYEVLIVRLAHQIDRAVLDAAGRLRAVASATTGLDHIDVDYAKSKGVRIVSLHGEGEFLKNVHATAEHTWALLLALCRRIPAAANDVRAGRWDRDRFRGTELHGKTLALLGAGRVALQVAAFAKAFGMRVLAYDPHVANWPAAIERVDRLDDLLSRADVVSIHVPLNEANQRLVGASQFSRLRRGVLLINTSRGEVVDEAALVEALRGGRLGGAALDVVAYERNPGRRSRSLFEYAHDHDNLIITPHIGGATIDSMAKTERFVADKLAEFLREPTKSIPNPIQHR